MIDHDDKSTTPMIGVFGVRQFESTLVQFDGAADHGGYLTCRILTLILQTTIVYRYVVSNAWEVI